MSDTLLDIHPVAGRIGAEVRNIRLSAELDPATFGAVRAALLRYKVLFFRGQQHLDDAGQEKHLMALKNLVDLGNCSFLSCFSQFFCSLGVSGRDRSAVPTALRHQGLLHRAVRAHHLPAAQLQRGAVEGR